MRSGNEIRVCTSNSRLTAVAVPEGTEAGEGSTVPGEDIAQQVGTDREGTGRRVAGTGEAAHLDL